MAAEVHRPSHARKLQGARAPWLQEVGAEAEGEEEEERKSGRAEERKSGFAEDRGRGQHAARGVGHVNVETIGLRPPTFTPLMMFCKAEL